MASMTDLIFLLLIFFMLTSNLVAPTALPVSLPSSKAGIIEIPKVNITVTDKLEYFVDDQRVTLDNMEAVLSKKFKGEGYVKGDKIVPVAVLYIDKKVAVEHLVKVAGIVNSLGGKVSLATKPE